MKKIILLIGILPFLLFAQQKVTVEALMQLRYPGQLAVSPDGSRFVFTVRTPDFQKSRWQTRLWMLSEDKKQPRQISWNRANAYQPSWSPDGRLVLFLSARTYRDSAGEQKSGTVQLWALPMQGGDAYHLTELENGVDDYRWMPDGKSVILLSPEEKSPERKKWEERQARLKFDAVVKDSVKENKVLWQLNLHGGKIRRVAVLDPGVAQFSLSHDGNWAVYQTNYTGDFNDEQKYDLWVVNLLTGEKQQLTDFPGPETQPKFSPDDRWVSYLNQTTPDVEFAETDLARIRFAPGATPPDTATLTLDLNRSVLEYEWEGNKSVILRVAEGTETHLYRFRPNAKKRRYLRLTPDGGNALDIHLLKKRGELFYRWEDATHLPEIVRNRKGRQYLLSDFSRQLDSLDLGTQRLFSWTSIDGQKIEGLLFLPPDFDSSKKYPLIVTIHGGPYGRFRQVVRQAYYTQVYTSAGYVVLAPNPRGSSGYDDAFGKAIWYKVGGHMGGIDYHDIMSGVDALVRQGYIDEHRMGVIGGSYGGYLVNWIISQTNRFAAAVSQFGIFSLFTDWSNSWQPAWEKMYLGIYYWERPITPQHPYVKYSPAFYVQNIRTPVLILHGERDRYTNLANSQEMYQALKTLGREVKFVVYPREGHGLGREPNHRRDVVHRAKKWFDRHLMGE